MAITARKFREMEAVTEIIEYILQQHTGCAFDGFLSFNVD